MSCRSRLRTGEQRGSVLRMRVLVIGAGGVDARKRQYEIEDLTFKTANENLNKQEPPGVPNTSLSKLYGYVVDGYGSPILNAKGQKQPVAKTKDKPPATSKDSASDIRLKRNQAVENLDTLLFDDTSQEQPSWVTQAATWNEIVPKINAAISNTGVNPNRPIGIQLRKMPSSA